MSDRHSPLRMARLALLALVAVFGSLIPSGPVRAANDPPPTATATVTGSQTVRVNWTSATGAVGYLVVPVVSGAQLNALLVEKSAGQTSHIYEDLENGTAYTFHVRAVYSGGISTARVTNTAIPVGPPGQPVLDVVPGDGQLEVSWSPVDDNGAPVEYDVEVTVAGSTVATDNTTGLSATFTDLDNEVLHRILVTASNSAGSTESDLASATPTTGIVPPSGLEATPDLTSVTLEWVPPAQTGGEDLDVYVAEITSPDDAPEPEEIPGTDDSFEWTGLESGVEYTFRMKAINVVGDESDWSLDVTVTTLSEGGGGGGGGITRAGRLGGDDRYATASLISQSYFAPGVPVVFLTTGLGFADALAGGAASAGDGPILLVTRDVIPQSTAAELDRLDPGRIVVLGGESVVSSAVFDALRGYTSGTVTRIGGVDRYATSVQVSAARFAPGVKVVFLATGLNFADALAAGPVGAPILLTRPECVPRVVLAEITRLRATSISVLGGTEAISLAVRDLTPCV